MFINADNSVKLDGYSGCNYYPDEDPWRFTYDNGKYTATLKIEDTENKWSVKKNAD